jgi:hypothetical protein
VARNFISFVDLGQYGCRSAGVQRYSSAADGGDAPDAVGGKEVASMYDSPFDYCPVCKESVALDQTLRQCVREHRCNADACPLREYFTGIEFAGDPVGGRRPKKNRR